MADRARALTLDDLAALGSLSASAHAPQEFYAAVDTLLQEIMGHLLFTIMRVHMLGNVLGPIFVYATALISVSMILAAGLSFLGLGTKPPEPEWGLMLNTLRTAIYVNPWVAALPGVMIFAVSICFNLLSDGMRSAMDIRN